MKLAVFINRGRRQALASNGSRAGRRIAGPQQTEARTARISEALPISKNHCYVIEAFAEGAGGRTQVCATARARSFTHWVSRRHPDTGPQQRRHGLVPLLKVC